MRRCSLPPDGAPWPTDRPSAWSRWVAAYPDTPHLAPRLINVLNRLGWLASPQATPVVLSVLGTRIQAIRRRSAWVVAWLQLVLKDRPEAAGAYKSQVQAILDGLAADGVESALRLSAKWKPDAPRTPLRRRLGPPRVLSTGSSCSCPLAGSLPAADRGPSLGSS